MAAAAPVVNNDFVIELIAPAIERLDQQTVATRKSQQALAGAVEELSEHFRIILDDQAPYDLAAYGRKLDDVRLRTQRVNGRIGALTERLGKLQREIARETFKTKQEIKQQPPADPPAR